MYKSYWYIYRICCSYNAELPFFQKQHTEASHWIVVVSYNETDGISPPFLICKTWSGTTLFRLTAQVYILQMCMHILLRKKKLSIHFAYYMHLLSRTILYSYVKYFSEFLLPRANWRRKKFKSKKIILFFKTFERC